MNLSRQGLIKHFQQFEIESLETKPNVKSAAVLVPFTLVNQQWHLVFIRRAEMIGDIHSGQVAFPGGTTDKQDDNLKATALREAQEEVGLSGDDITVLGGLPVFRSISNICVTPIVGMIPWPYRFSLQVSEVSRVFTIPLKWLSDKGNYTIKQRHVPNRNVPIDVIYYQKYDGEVLWGLTARIVHGLLESVFNHEGH